MPRLEGMHAPKSECAHILPPAGFKLPLTPDVFRFNRVAPHYPPDPRIRPNEGEIVCPPEYPPCPVNHPWMSAAGTDTRVLSDVFRFHKVYPSTDCNPCKVSYPYNCAEKRLLPCPCTQRSRYPPSKPSRHYDFRYPAGPTECLSSSHRYGHVPADCNVSFPSDDEIVYLDTPTTSDCTIYSPNRCGYAGQGSLIRNTQGDNWRTQYPQFNKNAHSCRSPSRILGNSMTNNGYGCPDASMYNNASDASVHSGTGDFSCTFSQGHYPMDGSFQYDSNSYDTSRNCDQQLFPFQKESPCPDCCRFYFLPNHVCRRVYDRNYLADCPEQDGPPADTYTFL